MAKGYTLRTLNRKLEVLRSFYRYYQRFTEFNQFPCAHIRLYRFIKPKAKFLSKQEVKNVLDGIKFGDNGKLVRDRLVLELLYQTGCRASEVMNLRKDDIDFNRNLCFSFQP
jgi:integrase/recombinase XerC